MSKVTNRETGKKMSSCPIIIVCILLVVFAALCRKNEWMLTVQYIPQVMK